MSSKPKKVRDWWRWWVVALLPHFAAEWLWMHVKWIRRSSWAPFFFGQASGIRGRCILPARSRNGETLLIDKARAAQMCEWLTRLMELTEKCNADPAIISHLIMRDFIRELTPQSEGGRAIEATEVT